MVRLIIIGAGEAGQMIASEILKHPELNGLYEICGFLDDDIEKKDLLGLPVLGLISQAHEIIEAVQADEALLAIPSASSGEISRILSFLEDTRIPLRVLPGFYEIVQGAASFHQTRPFEAADLLGREEVDFDIAELTPFYSDQTVLVTGAGGSIGSEIVGQLLELPVKRVVAFGHGENSIHELLQKYSGEKRLSYVIGDVRDEKKLNFTMKKFCPDVVFHAAAHKHVPLMEDYPEEAVKNNILGSFLCARAAIRAGVKEFLFVSTDKAVNPTSVMGASKRTAERLLLSMGNDRTRFRLTRFGNVLGSRGSVVPIFKRQIEAGGPLTVTHPDVTRFFMSIREAARLVIKSVTIPEGKVFVLDMGKPVKIADLARNMIRAMGKSEKEIPIVFTGLRPGEKLYEEVLTATEALSETRYEKLFISEKYEAKLGKFRRFLLLKSFERAAICGSRSEILRLITKVVPEYRRPL